MYFLNDAEQVTPSHTTLQVDSSLFSEELAFKSFGNFLSLTYQKSHNQSKKQT